MRIFFIICWFLTFESMASLKDVGVIGANGDVALFYREDDLIVYKECNPYLILGTTPEEARDRCKGFTRKVSINTFKIVLKTFIVVENKYLLKPLTPEEVENYFKYKNEVNKIEALQKELAEINLYIQTYGPENANLRRKVEIEKNLSIYEVFLRANPKVNALIDEVVEKISDQEILFFSTFSEARDQFSYNVLKLFLKNTFFPCGDKGTVEQRIKDCSALPGSRVGSFVLVSRTIKNNKVYKDLATGLLWTDVMPLYKYKEAQQICSKSLIEFAGIEDKKWRLPSIGEYSDAWNNGFLRNESTVYLSFWSSTVTLYNQSIVYIFIDSGIIATDEVNDFSNLRCVAR